MVVNSVRDSTAQILNALALYYAQSAVFFLGAQNQALRDTFLERFSTDNDLLWTQIWTDLSLLKIPLIHVIDYEFFINVFYHRKV